MSAYTYIYILLSIIFLMIVWIARLEVRITRLLAGKNARTLEDTILRLREELTKLFEHKKLTDERLDNMDGRVKKSVQWVETVRFNPFPDQGGNQSFSTAFVNEYGDGVVLTGLYGRDKSSVYAKPIRGNTSEHELSAEEKSVLKQIK